MENGRTLAEVLNREDLKDFVFEVHYDRWLHPHSTINTQESIYDISTEELIKEHGNWEYKGWYTTGTNKASLWVRATDEWRFEIPQYSSSHYEQYKDVFIADILDFIRIVKDKCHADNPYFILDKIEKAAKNTIGKYFSDMILRFPKKGIISIVEPVNSCSVQEIACVCIPEIIPRLDTFGDNAFFYVNGILCPLSENKEGRNEWIPVCSGSYPDDMDPVQVTYLGFYDKAPRCDAFAYRKRNQWYWSLNDSEVTVDITAWKRSDHPYVSDTECSGENM